MPLYQLTEDADADLEEIIRYTLSQWGVKQARLYTDKLHRCFEKIAGEKSASRPFSEKYPQARVTRCEHHYVFYLQLEGKPPRIFAVLHERMDLLARLKGRGG